jgi:lipopolysaccharide export system protein LptA
MKTTLALSLVLTLAACGCRQAQSPAEVRPPAAVQKAPELKTSVTFYRDTPKGKVLNILLSGDTWTNLAERDDLVTPFQMKSFHNGLANDVQLIGQSPECHVDQTGHRAWDAGPIVLFTPTTNVWVQGEGFLFVESNHLLTISNKVQTRVLRALLKTSMLNGAKTNAPATAGQILKIFADGPAFFDYQSNNARYFHHVHAIDVQLDLTSEKLSIQMTSNSVVQTILAEDNVVLTTTNKGWATGPRAYYYVTNGSEMSELTGGAVWHNGDEQAWADKFLYDSTRHLLTAIGHVRVWWPNGPQLPGVPPKAGAGGYRKMWADFATLQWPPTNGPVEEMHAQGNVVIVNQADKSRSTSDRADYVRTNNLFALSGHPEWWNDQMNIQGRTLTAEATNQIYHAHGGSNLKLKMSGAVHTNQWLYIASEELDYHTNLAVFTAHVRARLLENDVLRDTLTSDKLDIQLVSNEVKTAIAWGNVQGETAPDKLGRIKTIACDKLTAHRNPVTKMLTDILAENRVVLTQFGTNVGEPRNKLTSQIATAYFSAVVTNQLERAVAERDVVIDQVKTNQAIHATAARAVYTVAADEVKLTGTPVARTDRQIIANAEYMIWQPKTNRFRAFGPYSILPIRTNQPSSSALKTLGQVAQRPISSHP